MHWFIIALVALWFTPHPIELVVWLAIIWLACLAVVLNMAHYSPIEDDSHE